MDTDIWGFSFELPNTFGDHGKEWTEGRAVVWKALEMQAVVHPPTNFGDDCPNYGWWIGLVDLLSFAGGVDDIAEFLRNWGAANYEPSTPLQKFIRDNWGASLTVLELYLYLHPHARFEIFRYVKECKGHPIAEDTELTAGDDLIRLNATSYANAALRFARQKELANALFVGVDFANIDYLANARPSAGDPAHLSPHFAFQWAEHSADIEEGETLEFRNRGSALLSLGTYSGWYAKIHTLRRDFEKDPDTAGDFNRVEVEVSGLGSIGVFVFDSARSCFVLEGEEESENALTASPRYGFPLSEGMAEKLQRAMESDGDLSAGEVEQVEIHIRQEVELAHSLTYEILSPESGDGGWTRIDGEWLEGLMIPDGVHHKRCSVELIQGNNLDPKLPWHQAVLDGSAIYDVKPWAIKLVLSLWDCEAPVRPVFGELAGLDPEEDVSLESLDEDSRLELEAYVDSLPSFIKADESFLVEGLLSWSRGNPMTASDLLLSITEAESHR